MNRIWLILLGTGMALAAPAAAQVPELTVERLWGTRDFAGDLVTLRWTADGTHYTYTEPADSGTDLFRVHAETGNRELLVRGADLLRPGGTTLITIDDYAFSHDGTKLLIRTDTRRGWRRSVSGEHFLWDLRRRELSAVSAAPGPQLAAKFSPDGRYVGFVRGHNIFVKDLGTGREHQLTHDGGEDIINGTTDWVYEEELSLWDAFRFSPDGERIAFWRLDQSAIVPFYLLDETALYPELRPVRYPKAGAENSEVKIGVVEIATGTTRWMDLGPERDIYVAALDFADSSDEVWLTRLNRHQNRLDLMLADVATGESRVIMTDADAAWVDAGRPLWINGGEEFLYPSERAGFRQLFLFRRDGRLVCKLTEGEWDVLTVFGVDEDSAVVYFTGSMDGPLVRPIYRVDLDGTDLTRLSGEGGTHRALFNPTYTLYVDTHSTAARPPTQSLRRPDGRWIRTLAANEELAARVEALNLEPPEFVRVAVGGGVELNGYVIRPRDFDPSRRYPLLMHVYGGPGSQTVRDVWGGNRYLWHQMLAQQGYIVASVDNRGTGARGRDFKKMTYLRLGSYEAADQIAAARHFASLPHVDPGRVGIWGWSYGGYMSLLSMFRGEGVFSAAISVAPVTDWRLYDTIYTERFMRTPRENPEGYRLGAPLTYAGQLEGRLLVVHGTGDDNVHAQNTTQLILALQEANKQFDMRIYPNKAHAISGTTTRMNLYGYLTAWLRENL